MAPLSAAETENVLTARETLSRSANASALSKMPILLTD
ncbi:hypothetical protein N181_30905 [Sinorhizobium fredii USDA 205]|nr:hypothetical protein N181_30905 [Sinorhizobium fredii USDA 205]